MTDRWSPDILDELRRAMWDATTDTTMRRHMGVGPELRRAAAAMDRLDALGLLVPDDIDPAHIRPMLRLLGPARAVLDKYAHRYGEHAGQPGAEAAEMAQRIVDWIGHPVTDEPAWATLPCHCHDSRMCRPCMARMSAGYDPGRLDVDGTPVLDGAWRDDTATPPTEGA